jgi:hypothetical protein
MRSIGGSGGLDHTEERLEVEVEIEVEDTSCVVELICVVCTVSVTCLPGQLFKQPRMGWGNEG